MKNNEGSIRKSGILCGALGHGTLIVLSFVFILPFAWMVTTSFQPDTEFNHQARNPAFIPAPADKVPALNGEYIQTLVVSLRGPLTDQAADAFIGEVVKKCTEASTLLVVDLDVSAGDADAAQAVAKFLKGDQGDERYKKLHMSDLHKVCLVRDHALDVGAMVALACNSVVMTDQARLGQCGDLLASAPARFCRLARAQDAQIDLTMTAMGWKSLSNPNQAQLDACQDFLTAALAEVSREQNIRAAVYNEFLESARLDGFNTALVRAMVWPDCECWLIAQRGPTDKASRELQYVLAKDWASRVMVSENPGPAESPDPATAAADWERLKIVHDGKSLLTLDAASAVQLGIARGALDPAAMEKMLQDLRAIEAQPTDVTDGRAATIFRLLPPFDKFAPIKMAGELNPPRASRITPEGWFGLLAAGPALTREQRHIAYAPTTEHYEKALRRARSSCTSATR